MDRNEAIDILRVIAPPRTSKKAFYDFMEARDMAIAALEAYVPEMNVGDMISRQAVIDLLKQMRKDGDMVPWEGKNVFARIRKLPPAQPKRKTGQWIDKSNGIEGAWNYCSVCGEQAIDLYDFCPNCGADMRGNEDGAD